MIPPCYYLVCDFRNAGRETIIDWEDCSKESTIMRLLHGDHGGKVIGVHCIDRNDNTWADVSEDIAHEVMDRLEGFPPRPSLLEFLEDQLGMVRGSA